MNSYLSAISYQLSGIWYLVSAICLLTCGCAQQKSSEVVLYTSVDRQYAEPILLEFERRTGIKVKAQFDTEATKTTGLVNRLIAEKNRPRCDVFWNSEIARTIILKRKGILQPYKSPSAKDIPPRFKDKDGYWTGFAARARVVVYYIPPPAPLTGMVSRAAPSSIFNLLYYYDDVAIANPMFGTTATHVAALWLVLGEKKTLDYFRKLKANKVAVLEGNSVVRERVARGDFEIGFTDTDDVWVGKDLGQPVGMFFPDQYSGQIGTLIIPNTVALIKNCPHPNEGKKLIDYLLSREVEKKLAFGPSRQMPVRSDIEVPKGVTPLSKIKAMNVDYEKLADVMDEAVKKVRDILLP